MNTDQLRATVNLVQKDFDENLYDDDAYEYIADLKRLLDAARSWLRLMEGDEQLVERLGDAAQNAYHEIADRGSGTVRTLTDHIARAVLAAIVGEDEI